MITQLDLDIVIKAAKLYASELANTNVMYLFINKQRNLVESCEVTFLPQHFKHLTGIECNTSARHFYKLACQNKVKISECYYKEDGTTKIKLKILLNLLKINKEAKMIGNYNNSKLHIEAEKVAGNIHASILFVNDKEIGYCPSSSLRQDIRNIVTIPKTVLAIYQKNLNEQYYSKCNFMHKNYSYYNIPDYISAKIKEKLLVGV